MKHELEKSSMVVPLSEEELRQYCTSYVMREVHIGADSRRSYEIGEHIKAAAQNVKVFLHYDHEQWWDMHYDRGVAKSSNVYREKEDEQQAEDSKRKALLFLLADLKVRVKHRRAGKSTGWYPDARYLFAT